MTKDFRLIVGITGASGAIYGIRLLQALQELPVESHLVISRSAEMTIGYETDFKLREVQDLADQVHAFPDVGAAVSSGSFQTEGMIIAPCSIRSMSEIATGVTSNLLTRAADVVLKERRKLVLMLRETPLHSGHLRNLLALSEMGAVIAPPVPAFYHNPQSLDDVINQSVGRALDVFGLESPLVRRWGESDGGNKATRVSRRQQES
ncbi:MAG: UbiX family flavin prenyltransferase [Pseudomonadota bacterium]|uniref:UbiX family flavin prenyltransferase n=1 Tax=Fodinicurvata fenggangensis TaxID=1121830 RepID=UPI00068B4F7B|nr:UbiX family flavin prenyltransferase [Fodinicurvata fenggangensis]